MNALAALGREQRHDVIAADEARDARADLLDDSRALVPEHGRRVAGRIGAGSRVHVGVAYATGVQTHEHLARPRTGKIDVLHDERVAELLKHGRANLHRVIVSSRP